jgi:hypothetical protein
MSQYCSISVESIHPDQRYDMNRIDPVRKRKNEYRVSYLYLIFRLFLFFIPTTEESASVCRHRSLVPWYDKGTAKSPKK